MHTIELSNDSNTSSGDNRKQINASDASSEDQLHLKQQQQPRIYLKQDLAKPENLKPEMLVRFREALIENNGTNESSASENDVPQD